MAIISISEAARLTGKSRKTIQRYVADGRMSVSQLDAGKKGIETSELIRVFGEMSHPSPALSHETMSQVDAPNVSPDVSATLAAVQAENAALRAELKAKDENLADLRQSLRLLEYAQPENRPPKRRWFGFGRRG